MGKEVRLDRGLTAQISPSSRRGGRKKKDVGAERPDESLLGEGEGKSASP